MAIDVLALRDEAYEYLTTGSFTYFTASDVTDYADVGQIWVRAHPGCEVRQIYDYNTGRNTMQYVCKDDMAPSDYYQQLGTIAAEWGLMVHKHTTPDP